MMPGSLFLRACSFGHAFIAIDLTYRGKPKPAFIGETLGPWRRTTSTMGEGAEDEVMFTFHGLCGGGGGGGQEMWTCWFLRGSKAKAKDPKPKIQSPRSQAKDPKTKIQSRRSSVKVSKPKIPSQRSKTKDPKLNSKPKIPSQRSQARDPQPKIPSAKCQARAPRPKLQSQRSQARDPRKSWLGSRRDHLRVPIFIVSSHTNLAVPHWAIVRL